MCQRKIVPCASRGTPSAAVRKGRMATNASAIFIVVPQNDLGKSPERMGTLFMLLRGSKISNGMGVSVILT